MIIPRNWPGLDTVHVDEIHDYLKQHHWLQAPHRDTRLQAFVLQRDDEETFFLILPVNPGLTDFYPRLAEAIDRLAEAEQQPTFLVLQRFVRTMAVIPVQADEKETEIDDPERM